MGMTIEEATTRYKNNAEYERTHGNLQGCLEFRQLAEWLEKLQKIQEIIKDWEDGRFSDAVGCLRVKAVVEDGNDD